MISKTEGIQNMTKVYNKPRGRPSDINTKKIMIDIFRFEHMKWPEFQKLYLSRSSQDT